jgi:hypothetical protein
MTAELTRLKAQLKSAVETQVQVTLLLTTNIEGLQAN